MYAKMQNKFSKVSSVLIIGAICACVSPTNKSPSDQSQFRPVQADRSPQDFYLKSEQGMVAAGHALASRAGAKVLAQGGNAIDAAVAASFVISVVRPHSTGLGGGGFLLYFDAKSKESQVVDFRERAPSASSRTMFLDKSGGLRKVFVKGETQNLVEVPNPPMNGALSVAVPGLVKGLLEVHAKYGRLSRQVVMKDAIEIAKGGFEIYPTLASALKERRDVLALFAPSRKYFKNNEPLKLGDRLIQHDLAKTLQLISDLGDQGFYSGSVGESIVREVRNGTGILSQKDLKSYKVIYRKPVLAKLKSDTVLTMPPPSSGGVHIVQMLRMLEGENFKSALPSNANYLHFLTETMRRAFADRAAYMGDPDFVNVPTKQLTTDDYLKKLKSSIRRDRASVSTELQNPLIDLKESGSTTHISVVDKDGNAVSTTQTINYSFGSCMVAEGTGVVLNDEMDDFSTKPGTANAFGLIQGEANAVAPGKTPLSSMSPTIVLDEKNNVKLVLGSPGGPRIISAVLQTMINVLMFEMPLLESVHSYRIHHQWLPDQLRFEKFGENNGLLPNEEKSLKALGHELLETSSIGDVQAIYRNPNGFWEGASDSRAEGKPASPDQSL